MARLPELSKLSDEAYKALSPEQLMAYNKQMPEPNYDNPYNPSEHPYPRMKYALVDVEGGGRRLRSATVRNAAEEKALPPGYVNSPLELGIETAPGAPDIVTTDYDVAVAAAPVEAVVSKSKRGGGE